MAGRLEERREIGNALDSVSAKRDRHGLVPLAASPVALVGPRGVGKTVLLDIALQEARRLKVRSVELLRSEFEGGTGALAAALAPRGFWRWLGGLFDFRAWAGVDGYFGLEAIRAGNTAQERVKAALGKSLRQGPMLIVVDEAHTIPPEPLGDLCVVVQRFSKSRYPVSLLLAGTPGLEPKLMNIGATFMERSSIMILNLLSEGEAREAFTEGFASTGMEVEPEALDRLAGWSDRYPYFIQLAGAKTWDIVENKGASTVTLADAKEGITKAEGRRESFYERRHGELVKARVKPQALQLIEMMRKTGKGLTDEQVLDGLMEANDGMDFDQALAVMQRLMELGFIHKQGKRNQAGIPSLFDYVVDFNED